MESEGLSQDQNIGTYYIETLESYNVSGSNQQSLDSATVWVVTYRPLTMEAWVQFQANPCGICGEQNVIGTDFFLSTSVFPCHYHSTNASYSFIHSCIINAIQS
jgi:hypothetical protein